MRLLKQSSTAQPLTFLLVDGTDHITPETGLTPTVTLSKNGAAFAGQAGAVTEIGLGWYKVAGNATDTNTLGSLILHATATGADPTDREFSVVAFDPLLASLGLTIPGAAPTAAENAEALLVHDMSAVVGEAARSPLNALRFLRNGFSIAGTTLTVLKEDDATPAYTRDLTTNAAAVPIVGIS